MTKTDAEIAYDVYMRLKGETPRQRAKRKFADGLNEKMSRAMFEILKTPRTRHDDILDATRYTIAAKWGANGVTLF